MASTHNGLILGAEMFEQSKGACTGFNVEAGPELVLVASMMRSGTHLTIDNITNNIRAVHPSHQLLNSLSVQHPNYMGASPFLAHLRTIRHRFVLLKTHQPDGAYSFKPGADADLAARIINGARVLYVVRDPRDTMISLWHYIGTIDSTYQNRFTFTDHLEVWLPRLSEHHELWTSRSGVLTIRFEDWKNDFSTTLDDVCSFIGCHPVRKPVNVDGAFKRAPLFPVIPSPVRSAVPEGIKRIVRNLLGYPAVISSILPRTGEIAAWRHQIKEEHQPLFRRHCHVLMDRFDYLS